jgi:hypothetical protein
MVSVVIGEVPEDPLCRWFSISRRSNGDEIPLPSLFRRRIFLSVVLRNPCKGKEGARRGEETVS